MKNKTQTEAGHVYYDLKMLVIPDLQLRVKLKSKS